MKRIKSTLCLAAVALGLSSTMQGQEKSFVRDFVAELGDRKIEVEGVCSLSEDALDCWKPSGEKNPELQAEIDKYLTEKKNDYANMFRFSYNKKNRLLALKTTYLPKPDSSHPVSFAGVLQEQYSDSNAKNIWRSVSYISSAGGDPRSERTEKRLLLGSFDNQRTKADLPYFFNSPAVQKGTHPVKPGQISIGGNVYEILSITTREEKRDMNKSIKYTQFQVKLVKISDPDLILYLSAANSDGKPYMGFDAKGKPLLAEEFMKYMQSQIITKGGNSGFGSIQPNSVYGMSIDPLSSVRPSTDILMLQTNLEPTRFQTLALSVVKRTTFAFDNIHLDSK
jgi:hypothetical protein